MDRYETQPNEQNRQLLQMYNLAVRSQFCLQPAGDTLTRSHFFVSVLSGCVPVIFDRQVSSLYSSAVPTWWPWRSSPNDPRAKVLSRKDGDSNPFVDYHNFTVVFDASKVASSADFEKCTVALLEMPQRDPARYAGLRAGLDRVGKLMHYGMDMCQGVNCDAFAAFQGVLERLLRAKQRNGSV
jgi:hypothetical protein